MINNITDIPLGLAVWLVNDTYDAVNKSNYISVTSLMKPIRQIILGKRVVKGDSDLTDYIASAMGTAIHDSIEKAWTTNYQANLAKLGYPLSFINRVAINPTVVTDRMIPVYLEQRTIKQINGYSVGGKFDLILDGVLHDHKSTTTYTWIAGDRDKEYQLQGSIYRWLNQEKVVEDFIRIQFIFTDWSKVQALANPKYPKQRILYKDIPLLSIKETEQWVTQRLNQLSKCKELPENELPECTNEELWRGKTVYKYYMDTTKTSGRSTRTFDTAAEAYKYLAECGGKGHVLAVLGTPKRCDYCAAFSVCSQKDKYFTYESRL